MPNLGERSFRKFTGLKSIASLVFAPVINLKAVYANLGNVADASG